MNTGEEALGTCHYLLSQNCMDHYVHFKSRPYVNPGLIDAAIEARKGMLSLTLEHIVLKYQDQSDHSWNVDGGWLLWYGGHHNSCSEAQIDKEEQGISPEGPKGIRKDSSFCRS